MLDEERIENRDRNGSQDRRGHERSPEQGVRLDQVAHGPDGNGLHRSRGHEDQGVEELVPAEGEAEDARREQPGHGQGQDDLDQGLHPGAAVGHGALLDLLRDRPEVAHEQPRGERDELRGIGEDERPVGVVQVQLDDHLRERQEKQGRRNQVGQEDPHAQEVAAGKPQPGQGIADQDAADQGDDGGDHRYDDRVLHPLGEVGVLKEVDVVLQREGLDPERVVLQFEEIVRRLEGDDAHPVEREEEKDQEKRQRQVDASECVSRGSCFRPCLLPPQVDQKQDGEDRQDREHVERDRRALADVRCRQPDLVGIGAEDVGRVGRPALGQDVDQLEIGKGPDDGEQGGDQDDPSDGRDRDMKEPLPGVRAVDGRRLVQLLGDGLKSRQDRDGEERDATPDVGQADRGDRQVGIAQEVDVLFDQPQGFEEPGDGAEDRVEDHEPAERGERGGHDPRHHHRGPDRIAEAHPVVQDHGQSQPQRRLEGDGHHGVDQGVPRGLEEDGIAEEVDEVPEADEVAHAADDAVGEGEPDAEEEGIGHEDDQQEGARQHEDDAQAGFAIEKLFEGPAPCRLPSSGVAETFRNRSSAFSKARAAARLPAAPDSCIGQRNNSPGCADLACPTRSGASSSVKRLTPRRSA